MKSNMVTGLMILGAAIVAGVAGFFIGKGVSGKRSIELQEDFNDLVERYEEMQTIANREIEKNHRLLDEMERSVDRSLQRSSKKIKEALDEDELMSPIPRIQNLREKPDLMELTKKYGNPRYDDLEDDATHDVWDDDDEEYGDEPDEGPPREIPKSDINGYEPNGITIDYYPVDRVLIGERDIPYDDPIEIVGKELWEDLPSRSEDAVYVWNPEYDTMYEVIINHGMAYREEE